MNDDEKFEDIAKTIGSMIAFVLQREKIKLQVALVVSGYSKDKDYDDLYAFLVVTNHSKDNVEKMLQRALKIVQTYNNEDASHIDPMMIN